MTAELRRFLSVLDRLSPEATEPALRLLTHGRAVLARAPGRLDVMGGIADYSGSCVLQLPIEDACYAAVEKNDRGLVRVASFVPERAARYVELGVGDLAGWMGAGLTTLKNRLNRDRQDAWAAYPVGALLLCMAEGGVKLDGGLDVVLWSTLPEGKGLSSSAALEVATASAVRALFGLELSSLELALLCQRAENQIVGAPCGAMDQVTVACGKRDELLEILCQPALIRNSHRIADSLRFYGINSGLAHSVAGASYTDVRAAAFMGYRVLADLSGLDVVPAGEDGQVSIFADPHCGYWANVPISEFEGSIQRRLPVCMRGAEFLKRYGGTTDSATSVDPDRNYAIRACSAHPVFEHARVGRFRDLLLGADAESARIEMGQLMYASHASYTACGLGSPATDLIVDLVRQAGPGRGLYGAKVTGAGSGGTVAVLARADAEGLVRAILHDYIRRGDRHAQLIAGSSDGACRLGAREAQRRRGHWTIAS